MKALMGILGPKCTICGKVSLFQETGESILSDNTVELYMCQDGHTIEMPLIKNKHDKN